MFLFEMGCLAPSPCDVFWPNAHLVLQRGDLTNLEGVAVWGPGPTKSQPRRDTVTSLGKGQG